MKQMRKAIAIAKIKYPMEEGWKVVWVFDQSSCHKAMAADALDALKMNVNPGGKQSKMTDTVWAGKPQKLWFNLGVPKGMKQVLKERGINTDSLNAEKMREILKQHDDFKNEKPRLITELEKESHIALYLPKFHPELNPIERVWAQSKQYTKAHCKYTLPSLRSSVPLGLHSVSLDNIKNFQYMFAYFEGHVAGSKLEEQVKKGSKLEEQVKKHKTAVKSYRRIGINE